MQTGSTRTGSSEWYSRRKKTDISFLISGMMNLYEHQSTFNPNMPVRGLIYLCRLYEKYIVKNEIDIYTSSLKELPFPQYFVFYNGTEKEPDRQELKLSDMFISVNRCEVGTTPGKTALMEVKEEFGITVHSIISVADIYEYLKEQQGYEAVLKLMEEYMDKYCIL